MQSFTAMAEEEKQSKQLVMKAHARALQCPPNKSTSLKNTAGLGQYFVLNVALK